MTIEAEYEASVIYLYGCRSLPLDDKLLGGTNQSPSWSRVPCRRMGLSLLSLSVDIRIGPLQEDTRFQSSSLWMKSRSNGRRLLARRQALIMQPRTAGSHSELVGHENGVDF